MLVTILKERLSKNGNSKGEWYVDYLGGSVYPVRELTKGQKLVLRSEEIGESHLGSQVSVEEIRVLISNPDGTCDGLFCILPRSAIEKPFSENERKVDYGRFCSPEDGERISKQIAEEAKGLN